MNLFVYLSLDCSLPSIALLFFLFLFSGSLCCRFPRLSDADTLFAGAFPKTHREMKEQRERERQKNFFSFVFHLTPPPFPFLPSLPFPFPSVPPPLAAGAKRTFSATVDDNGGAEEDQQQQTAVETKDEENRNDDAAAAVVAEGEQPAKRPALASADAEKPKAPIATTDTDAAAGAAPMADDEEDEEEELVVRRRRSVFSSRQCLNVVSIVLSSSRFVFLPFHCALPPGRSFTLPVLSLCLTPLSCFSRLQMAASGSAPGRPLESAKGAADVSRYVEHVENASVYD